jgi:hypothetical protein
MIGNDTFSPHDDDVFFGGWGDIQVRRTVQAGRTQDLPLRFSRATGEQPAVCQAGCLRGLDGGLSGIFLGRRQDAGHAAARVEVASQPSSVGIRSVETSMHYKIVHVGRSDVVLPLHSQLTSFDQHGNYRLNTITLEHYQEFSEGPTVT